MISSAIDLQQPAYHRLADHHIHDDSLNTVPNGILKRSIDHCRSHEMVDFDKPGSRQNIICASIREYTLTSSIVISDWN